MSWLHINQRICQILMLMNTWLIRYRKKFCCISYFTCCKWYNPKINYTMSIFLICHWYENLWMIWLYFNQMICKTSMITNNYHNWSINNWSINSGKKYKKLFLSPFLLVANVINKFIIPFLNIAINIKMYEWSDCTYV